MARTWSYRKRDITINEVKPKGVPPVVYAYVFIITMMLGIVIGTSFFYIKYQLPDAVIMGMKSDSYKTEAPHPGTGNFIKDAPKSGADDGPTVIDVH